MFSIFFSFKIFSFSFFSVFSKFSFTVYDFSPSITQSTCGVTVTLRSSGFVKDVLCQ